MKKGTGCFLGVVILLMGAHAFAQQGVIVGRVVVEKHVARHIGRHIDLVSLGPGSGWLRLITSDGLSPIISFDSVTKKQIRAFNRFALSLDYPFRTELDGSELFIRHNRNRMVSHRFIIDPKATRKLNLNMHRDPLPLIMKKTKSGKIRLFAARPEAPGDGRQVLRRPSDYRQAGFRLIQKGFAALSDTPDLDTSFVLKNVTIRIVGSRGKFNKEAASHGDGVLGYATADNEITVLGKQVGESIVVNQAVLGHELNHLLNFANLNVANPDDLDGMGL